MTPQPAVLSVIQDMSLPLLEIYVQFRAKFPTVQSVPQVKSAKSALLVMNFRTLSACHPYVKSAIALCVNLEINVPPAIQVSYYHFQQLYARLLAVLPIVSNVPTNINANIVKLVTI